MLTGLLWAISVSSLREGTFFLLLFGLATRTDRENSDPDQNHFREVEHDEN